jgi:isopentenyl diphosphate isomerase/L-lactate dehydrogenase-like FMN-dependent dehydrogenase
VSERHLSTTILGNSVSMPICASPTAMQKLAHPIGETATVKGFCRSTVLFLCLTNENISKNSSLKNYFKFFTKFRKYCETALTVL